MAAKKFVLRIDDKMYAALEKWAADEFRSVNGQIEWIIQQQLKSTNRLLPKLRDEKEISSEITTHSED
ncbi:Arc family DNA binding domain-containing protein [Rhizosphaericola mali]|uniref:Arc family DNA binding domain-containing protein n=1 Tax=Rhizosphaericola mali TaxID=2545455 RepID=UPI001CD99E6B|nr:Arc family DNA binding domain-containing protein [Rhizosphaericola mali]